MIWHRVFNIRFPCSPETLSLYKANQVAIVPSGRPLVILVLLATALAILAIGVFSDGTEAYADVITVNLEDSCKEQTAFPTDTKIDILEFDGCLTLSKHLWVPGYSVVIRMEIEMSGVDKVWEYHIDPPTHTFTFSGSQSFKAQVTVPARFPTTIDFLLEFTAYSNEMLLYDVITDTAQVKITQYYKIHCYFSTQPINIQQDDMVDLNFVVENVGNGKDTFIFEVDNETELLFAGLTLIYNTSMQILMGEEENVRIHLVTAADAHKGQFQVNLTIKSENSTTDPNYENPVTSIAELNVLILSDIVVVKGDEKVIVEGFNKTYYMENTSSVEISTKIAFMGDNINDEDVPIVVIYYTMDWKVISKEEVSSNKVRTQVHENVYEYHDYSDTFGFETNVTGDLEFRLIVNLGNHSWFSEVYIVHVDPGHRPDYAAIYNIILVIVLLFSLTIILLLIRKPLVRYYRSQVSAKIDDKKKQHDQAILDLQTMIRITYEKGGITEEEMIIFERRRKEIGLSLKEFQGILNQNEKI